MTVWLKPIAIRSQKALKLRFCFFEGTREGETTENATAAISGESSGQIKTATVNFDTERQRFER